MKTVSIIPLSKEQHDSSEGGITEKEFLKSLKSMQNGMSPGNDSYIEEFCGTLWNDTKKPFYQQLKKSIKYNNLRPFTNARSYKTNREKGRDKRLVKNWRPISLLM